MSSRLLSSTSSSATWGREEYLPQRVRVKWDGACEPLSRAVPRHIPLGCPPLLSHRPWGPKPHWVVRQGAAHPGPSLGTFKWTSGSRTHLLLVPAQSCCSSRAVGWGLSSEARDTQLLWYAAFLPLPGPFWQAESKAPRGGAMPGPDSESAVGLMGDGSTRLPAS